MKLLCEFDFVDIDGTITAVPVGDNAESFCGVLSLNGSGAEILKLIAESQSLDEVLEKLCALYPDDNREVIAESLNSFAGTLIKERILTLGD